MRNLLFVSTFTAVCVAVFAIFASPVVSAYDQKNWDFCQRKCDGFLGKDRFDQGIPFTNCLKDCLK